jgi:hypothetical protein
MAEHYNIEYDELKNQFTADNIEIISQDIRNRKAIQLMFDEAVFK